MSKHLLWPVLALSLLATLLAAAEPRRDMNRSWVDKVDPDYQWASPQAYETWKDRKFGVRIHWGLYSTLGVEASWPLIGEDPNWQKLYLTQYEVFNPTEFDADRLAEDAERWGFRYFVFTTKHMDGFSMFDTRQTDLIAALLELLREKLVA